MPPNDEYPHYIEFRHVYKTFDKPVLVDSNFYVDAGHTVAIIGRSGVGKSVTLAHIMGFLKPDNGRVIVAHEEITDFSEPELRRIRKKVTMVFQASGGHRAGAGGATGVHSVRRAHHHGRSHHVRSPGRTHAPAQTPIAAYLGRRHTRSGSDVPRGRPCRVSPSRASHLLRTGAGF